MVDSWLIHELLLGVLFWLAVHGLLQQRYRYQQSTRCQAKCQATKQSSKATRPFPGLTQKPHCEDCAQAAVSVEPTRPVPPPVITPTAGRPRTVRTLNHYCPDRSCPYYGWLGRGNIRANGHPNGRRWRQLHCVACGRYFLETHGTLFHGKTRSAEDILRAIAALAEGLGIRSVARVFEVEPNTVLSWLVEAADHAEALSQYLLHDLDIQQVQLDELFALVSDVKAGQVSEGEAIERLHRTPCWAWAAVDPVSKLWLAVLVGERTLAMAQQLVHRVAEVLAKDCRPLFLTDGLKDYGTALLTHFGQWVQPPRRQNKGPLPKPRWLPQPSLLYAQVIKKRRRRRLVAITQRIVFGTAEQVKRVLAPTGWRINTAFIERLNLTIRQHVAAIGRRVITLAKSRPGLQHQLSLFRLYYNVCLPHSSLRQRLVEPEPGAGTGSQRWQACTPAMAAGITDQVWSLREVLLYRIPPWRQPLQA